MCIIKTDLIELLCLQHHILAHTNTTKNKLLLRYIPYCTKNLVYFMFNVPTLCITKNLLKQNTHENAHPQKETVILKRENLTFDTKY